MDSVFLSHGNLTLRPLSISDAAEFRTLTEAEAWQGMAVPLPTNDESMADYLSLAIDSASTLAFAIEVNEKLVGKTTIYDIVPGIRAEIGSTYLGRSVWGTSVNPTCKLLLFRHAFETMGLSRVGLRCDHRNKRSHAAIARLGATFEGTLRNFRLGADGSLVDVDYFSVIKDEWPEVRSNLLTRI